MTSHNDTIIIGAGQSDLTPNPSPKGEGNAPFENKNLRFRRGLPGINFQIFDFAKMGVA